MDALTHLLLAGAGSPLILLAVFIVVAIDGFFPPVPSETVVVALASIGFATGAPNPWIVLLLAAAGSFVGDNLAFTIGRRLGIDRFRFTRGPRTARLLGRVRGTLEERSASTILTARFIPVGRVAVNVLAGSSAFPRRRFVVLSAISGVLWAGYSIVIGVVAGAWFHEQPILGAAVAAVAALGIGLLVDRISRRRRRSRRPVAVAPTQAAARAARVSLETTGGGTR
ncbi:membrane protein [Frondihabitans sucicola]|uniref:Membrane protein n=1 Tax=Frondihabitans sucicola TaxID=1268041 RepID=A0ABN6XWV5_9MICO|nr:DedA family protein [Frondihabitans sucicola]BDZ49450.1 membrane protein [Frondihabitans sucicola]